MEYPLIRVALVADKCSPVAKVVECSWGKLQKQLCKISIGEKDGAAWMPVDIDVGARTKDRVRKVHVLVLDVERTNGGIVSPPSVDQIAEQIGQLDYSAIIHTTHSHTPDEPRYRIIFEVDRPIEKDELKMLGQHIAQKLCLSHCYDRGALEPARLYYLPRCPQERLDDFRGVVLQGNRIRVDEVLREAAERLATPKTATIFNFPTTSSLSDSEISDALGNINADCERAKWRDVVWAVLATGSARAIDLALEWSQAAPHRFNQGDFDSVVDSFDPKGGIGVGTLLHYAKNSDVPEPIAAEMEARSRRFPLLNLVDLASLPPLQWRVKELLPSCGLAAVYGPSGSGKSFLVLDLLSKIVLGRDFYGLKVTKCPVIYAALEGSAGVRNRIRAWEKTHSNIGDQFWVMKDAFSLLTTDCYQFASELLAGGFREGVIVIDTLNQSAPQADENSSKDMGTIIANAKHLALATSSLVILVHHSGKDSSRGLRGHSSLLAALDAAIEVEKKADGRSWKASKVKDGVDSLAYDFDLKSVVLGTDEDGADITSCVAVPAPFRAQKLLAPRGDNQRKVLDTFRGSGSSRLTDADLFELAKTTLQEVDPKHRASRAKEAVSSLLRSGHLIEEDGFLKIVN